MNSQEKNHKAMKNGNYGKFVGMLAASFVAMYITMYLNTRMNGTTFGLA